MRQLLRHGVLWQQDSPENEQFQQFQMVRLIDFLVIVLKYSSAESSPQFRAAIHAFWSLGDAMRESDPQVAQMLYTPFRIS